MAKAAMTDEKKLNVLSFTEGDKETLVAIVKASQYLRIRGTSGGWKEFLALHDKLNGSSISDPAKRHWQILAKFVQTFACEEDIQMVKRMKSWKKWCKENEFADANDPWPDSPEQGLVKLTHENPRFKQMYNFPSFQEGWRRTKRGRSTDAGTLLSLDCEMVKCENNEEEVVQVCIVNRNCETVLDTLVKPSKLVVDYVTNIHGISPADLEKATCTQEDVQKKVMRLLKPGTILVGHSLHHDLKVLKIDHRRVVDTSMIFRHDGVADAFSIALTDLCKAILGFDFREEGKPHKCIDDAIIPMKIVLHELQHGPSEPLNIGLKKLLDRDPDRLFIHKIPPGLSTEDLRSIFSKEFPCNIEEIQRRNSKARSTCAIFSSRESADRAFEMLRGELGKDSWGREQKIVTLLSRAQRVQVYVRKMVVGSKKESAPLKRAHELVEGTHETSVTANPKKLKSDQEPDLCINICSCGHTEELQRLKMTLEARDKEIMALKKLITGIELKGTLSK